MALEIMTKFHSWRNSFCCINISKYYKNQKNKLQVLKLEECEKNDYISTIMGIKMKVILHIFSHNILCPLGSICHQYQNEKSRICLIISKNCFRISNSLIAFMLSKGNKFVLFLKSWKLFSTVFTTKWSSLFVKYANVYFNLMCCF